jgi:uncharacterized protein YeaO (DUF488 family)
MELNPKNQQSKELRRPALPLKTKRWNDPKESQDGFRILICRYRPRGVSKRDETWDSWYPEFAPSKELHADFYGKHGAPISWEVYQRRYLDEMQAQEELIAGLAELIAEGANITLLCSSACTDASHCHRTLLQELVEAKLRNATVTDAPVLATPE